MHIRPRYLAIATLSVALVSLIAYAAQPSQRPADHIASSSPDLLPSADLQRLSLTARQVAPRGPAVALTREEVGDVDSFGRAMKWLGAMQGNVNLREDCSEPGSGPQNTCVTLDPANGYSAFQLEDLDHITLPAGSAKSLLCHWFSPFLGIDYENRTTVPVVAQLRYYPTLTVENEVLDDPSLIDATTGLAFNGKLTTAMSSSEAVSMPMSAGQSFHEIRRDSNVCIGGFLTRSSLVEMYGLTEAQAGRFFRKPITVRMNIRGNSQHLSGASLTFGMRIVGD